jgi:hypothetical protein
MSSEPGAAPGSVVLSGSVLLDGHGVAEQRLLVLSEDMTCLLGSAATDAGGRFTVALHAAQRDATVVLVAKLQGPVLGLTHRIVTLTGAAAPPQELRFDTRDGGFHTVRGTIAAPGAVPPSIEVSLSPAHLEGVPAPVESFFLRQSAGVVDAAFFELLVTGREFELDVQPGNWRIAGGRIDYRRPMSREPRPENVVVARIDADGEQGPLPGERFGGFTLDVRRDRRVTLTLEVLPDEELGLSVG